MTGGLSAFLACSAAKPVKANPKAALSHEFSEQKPSPARTICRYFN